MRRLGSFNRFIGSSKNTEDNEPSGPDRLAIKTLQTGGYTLGIAHNAPPNERRTPTGGDFTQGRKPPGRQRMAGQDLGAYITRSTGMPSTVAPAEPVIGSAELRTPNIPQ